MTVNVKVCCCCCCCCCTVVVVVVVAVVVVVVQVVVVVYVLLIAGSEQRLQMITTIITETERDIKIIHEDLVELGDGLPELSSGLTAQCLSNSVLTTQYSLSQQACSEGSNEVIRTPLLSVSRNQERTERCIKITKTRHHQM